MLIIFFSPGSSPRRNPKIPKAPEPKINTPKGPVQPGNIPGVEKYFRKFINALKETKGKIPDSLLPHVNDYLGVLSGLITHKVTRNLFVSLVDHVNSSLSNFGSNKLPMIYQNEVQANNNSKILRTHCHVGHKGGRRIKKAKQGAFHGSTHIVLEDTEQDRIDHNYRKQLHSSCGFGQKGYDIFLEDSFIRITDLINLCNADEYFEEIKEEKKRFAKSHELDEEILKNGWQDIPVGSLVGTGRDIWKNRNRNRTDTSEDLEPENTTKSKNPKRPDRGLTKYYAGITKTVTKLKIRNIFPVYDVRVFVHLCQPINHLEPDSPRKLYGGLINATPIVEGKRSGIKARGIKNDCLYSFESLPKVDNYCFKVHLDTALNTKIERTDAFRHRAQIVKTWVRELKENDQFHLTLHEHLGDGIYLNQLEEIKEEYGNSPFNYFFIVEYFGDRRATITRNKDGDSFHGYSPAALSYRLKQEIHYVMNQNDPDIPIVLKFSEKDGNFETKELMEMFCPTRESPFNVDYDNIKINGKKNENKNPEFTLDFASDIVSTTLVSDLTNILEDLGIPEPGTQPEDLIYTNTTDTEDNDEPHHDPPENEEDDKPGYLRNVKM